MKRTIFCLIGLCAGNASAQQPPASDPLTVDEILSITEFADRNQLDLSPDGRWVAFALQDPRRTGMSGSESRYFDGRGVPRGHVGTDVYVADVRTGATRRLGDGSGSSWAPVWSPGGRYLAFYSDRDGLARLWIWEPESDRVRRLSDAVVRVFFGFEQVQWSPDGRRVLVKLLPKDMTFHDVERLLPQATATANAGPGPAEDPRMMTAREYSHQPQVARAEQGAVASEATPDAPPAMNLDSTRSFLNAELSDLALVDVESGEVRRVAHRVRAMGYRFDTSGGRVAFSTRQPDGGTGMLVYDRYDLWVVDTRGEAPWLLAPATVQEYGLGFSWSPDGERIAFESDGAVHVVRADDGTPVHVFRREGLALAQSYRPPLWLDDDALLVAALDTIRRLSLTTGDIENAATPAGRALLEIVAPADAQRIDGPEILVAVSDRRSKKAGLQRLDLESGQADPLFEGNVALGGTSLTYQLDAGRNDQGPVIAFVAESGERPADVSVFGPGSDGPVWVTELNARVSARALGRSRLIEWVDEEGRELQGALLLPLDYELGRRYPLVVKVYGGRRLSGRVNRFGLEPGIDNLQLLASRGYVVLLADAPARNGSPAADIAAAVGAGIESVVQMGIADRDRVAVLGHSYGGYSALAVATRVPGLAVIISSGGFSNLFSQYTEMREDGSVVGIGWSERGQGRMPGHPWEHRETYLENSPFFYLDRITAPVLLLHGGSDPTVLAQRAQETFVALRRLDKEVKLVLYEGEGHHPASWSIENAADYWQRIFNWLDWHLRAEQSQA